MAIEVKVPRSPGWWMRELGRQLHDRRVSPRYSQHAVTDNGTRPGLDLLDSYLRGRPPLRPAAKGYQDGVRAFMRASQMNYALMCTQSVQQRMVPVGFTTAVDDDRNGDDEAARIFDANELGLRFTEVLEWMLGLGDGYAIVGEPERGGGMPLITAEDPREVITAHDPATGRGLAGLKLFRDDWDSSDVAFLYLADVERVGPARGRVYVARKERGWSSLASTAAFRFNAGSWDWDTRDGRGGENGVPLPDLLGGQLPVVRFRNFRGVGDFEPHLGALDRINDGIFQRVSVALVQAFRQRGIEGLPDRDPKTNELIDYSAAFLADPGSMWRLPKDSKIWESQPIDLGPIRLAVKDDVEGFAAVSGTPLYYLTPDAAQGSAEGAETMREQHAFRVEDRTRRADSGLAKVMSLAFAYQRDKERADPLGIRTLWAPAERHSLEQRASAASQAKAGGMPQAEVDTKIWGYAPRDLPRLERERARDLLLAPATPAAPTPTPAGGGRG